MWQSVLVVVCYRSPHQWSVVKIRGMVNVKAEKLKFIFFLMEKDFRFVGDAGAK